MILKSGEIKNQLWNNEINKLSPKSVFMFIVPRPYKKTLEQNLGKPKIAYQPSEHSTLCQCC